VKLIQKMHHPWKNAAHLKKCATLGKMRHTSHNARKMGETLKKCGTLGKLNNTRQNAPNSEKCLTLRKMPNPGKMRHT